MWNDSLTGRRGANVADPLAALPVIRTVTAPVRFAPVRSLATVPMLEYRPTTSGLLTSRNRATVNAGRLKSGGTQSLGALPNFYAPVRAFQPKQSAASGFAIVVPVDRDKRPTVLSTPHATRDAKMRRARVADTAQGLASSKDVASAMSGGVALLIAGVVLYALTR